MFSVTVVETVQEAEFPSAKAECELRNFCGAASCSTPHAGVQRKRGTGRKVRGTLYPPPCTHPAVAPPMLRRR